MTPPTTELSIRADRRAAAIVAGARAWPVILLRGAAEPRTERIAERDVATGVRLRLREGGTRSVDLRSALEGPEDAVARVLQAVVGPGEARARLR